jgi:hypothetical protein
VIDPTTASPATDYHALALELEDELFAMRLKESELRMARAIIKMSLRSGRTSTPPMLQKDLGLIARLRETHTGETLGWLLGKRVIELESDARSKWETGSACYRVNPNPKTWLVNDRGTPEAREREAELLRDQSQSEFFDQRAIRAGDYRVALADAEMEVRASEIRKSERPENFRNSEVEPGGKLPEFGSGSGRSPVARTRVRAACHEASSSKKHVMSCHANVPFDRPGATAPIPGTRKRGLTDPELDLLGQIAELTENECRTDDFRKTWEARVQEHPMSAFKAIAETRVIKREGRIKNSVGGTLNYYFKHFRDGSRASGQAAAAR